MYCSYLVHTYNSSTNGTTAASTIFNRGLYFYGAQCSEIKIKVQFQTLIFPLRQTVHCLVKLLFFCRFFFL